MNVRVEIDDIVVQPSFAEYRTPQVKPTSFHDLSEMEIRDIIMKSSNVYCKMDPIPA